MPPPIRTHFKRKPVAVELDVSGDFLPIASGTAPPANTGFILKDVGDFSTIYAAYTSGTKAPTSGFYVKNYNNTGLTLDLNSILAYNSGVVTNTAGVLISAGVTQTTYNDPYNGQGYYYFVMSNGTQTIKFTSLSGTIAVTIIAVGGGGAGTGANNGGGGGGGGGVVF